ncbi:Fpg/Nei family DNA glycosylase [Actinomycetia phage DSL-LC01]|nr:Fpg/Nei family DNA glycosylase [Actinomycetia phage DSL-LC01]
MPEGHSIRHLATVHSYGFVGTKIEASSPQGRFAEGAALIDGQVMTDTSAHGKHLFLHFPDNVVHVHLGLYGWFKTRKNKGQKASNSTRLRVQNDAYISDLSGPTACEIMTYDEMIKKKSSLGEDPIHESANPEIVWQKIKKSRKSVGLLLMDQAVVAGIGNVYRAELLFLSNVSPFIPGKDLDEQTFRKMWKDSVDLLRLGAEDGKIKTVLEEHLTDDEVKLHGCTQTSYVYKRTGNPCRKCGSNIMSDDMGGRTVYWCPSCQK